MRPATLDEVEAIVADRLAELERRLDPRAYTVRQVAERLSLSVTRVRELIRAGELRSFKVGGSRRVDPGDLALFLDERRRRTVAPTPAREPKPAGGGWSPGFLERLHA
jgi:excisionase family DNA binding protein